MITKSDEDTGTKDLHKMARKMAKEIKEDKTTYFVIFTLLGIGIYFFVISALLDFMRQGFCCTSGLMGFVVILMGDLQRRNDGSVSGILLMLFGIGMMILTVMGFLYTAVITMS